MTDTTQAGDGPLTANAAVQMLLERNTLGVQAEEPASSEPVDETTEVEPGEAEAAEEIDDQADDEELIEAADADEVDEAEDADDGETELVYTVKVDGQEVDVTEQELLNGYQRQADYTRKSQAVAEQRKANEAEIAQARQLRDQYAAALQQVEQIFTPQDPGEEHWNKLYESDPLEYVRARDQFRSQQEAFQKVISERQQLSQQQQAEVTQQREAHLAEQRDEMVRRIPAWSDPDVFTKEREALKTWANDAGITDEEIAGITDARAVETLRKAWLYDQLVSDKTVKKKKAKPAPKVSRSGQPRGKVDGQVRRKQTAMKKLSKTGKLNDAVEYLLTS
jgi:hypothetical protein